MVQRLHRHESDVYPEVVAKDCSQTDIREACIALDDGKANGMMIVRI